MGYKRAFGWRPLAASVVFAIALGVLPPGGGLGVDAATAPPVTLAVDTPIDLGATASCSVPNSGKCSLRKAIALANASSGGTITIPAGNYVLNGGAGADTGDLDLTKNITLIGADVAAAAAGTKIVGSNDRVFDVAGAGVTVTMRGLRVTGGTVSTDVGGGIRVAAGAKLTLTTSTVSGNTAKEGGGINNSGTVTIDRSTISSNTTSAKGGGLSNAGSATIRNSTISGNSAKGGGGIANSGSVTVTHSNVTGNNANNSNGGGLYRVGGTFTVKSTIVADNNGATGRDCYGAPTFLGVNLVEGTTGCNPVGSVITLDPALGALADNGGPTLTQLPASSSPAINATPCDSTITVDQRNVARPAGARCDLGAVEVAPLTFDVTLAATPDRVNVGVQSVPIGNIPPSVLGTAYPSSDTDTTEESALARIALARIALARIDVEGTALARIALARILIDDLALARIAVSDTALARILISEIEPGGGWQAILAGSVLENLPVQTITLAEVLTDPVAGPRLRALDLTELDVNATMLGELPLVLFAFAGQTFDTLPPDSTSSVPAIDQWSALLDVPAADLAGKTPLSTALARIDVEDAALARIALARIDILASALARIALARIDVDASDVSPEVAALARIALARIDLTDTALARIALARITIDSTALARIALARIALARIDIANTALARIALARIALARIDTIVDCERVDCPTGTLLDALNASPTAIRPTATIADLILGLQGSGDTTQIQDLLTAASTAIESGGIELADLLRLLAGSPLDGLTLADLFPAFLSDADLPWQDIDLEATPLQNLSSTPVAPATFTSTITVGNATPSVSLSLSLPPGFAVVAGSAGLDLNGAAAPAAAPVPIPSVTGTNTLAFQLGTVPPGTHTFSVQARAGIRTGTFDAALVGVATIGTTTRTDDATASVSVDENPDTSFGPLTGDSLYVGHLVSSDDDDVYTTTFEVTPQEAAEGRRGTVYLSNLAVDYDLAVFGPAVDPLRAPPIESIVPVDDRQLGADPGSEVVAPDAQYDIPLTAPAGSVLTGLSANRASAPERVDLGDLRAGTYTVQVTGYNGAFSDQPFTLRVRTQSLHLPPCSARVLPSVPAGTSVPIIPDGIDTLFVVPVNRLRQLWGVDQTTALMAELDEFMTLQPGGVVAGMLPVDADYAAWDQDRCFPDAANDVARSIAAQIDGVRSANPSLRHLVMVGDDVALPFFRLADATTTANESSYAQGFGDNNALVGALARGYVQSDDPYATTRGIAVNGRELFVPELAAGRLLETKDDIVKALDTFETHQGRLDPATASSALVTGYDFLTDGGTSIADALDSEGFSTTSLINEDWTTAQLIDRLVTADPDIASLNAHFDHNRALPADQNAAGSEGDLFTVDDLPTDERLAAGLLFSMGCHSGLSVSDIELGVNDDSADWTQAFAGSGAQWIGNTGFGYGDTELVAYSERLMTLFSERLAADGSITTGEALSLAKRAYASTTQVWSPYDEKVLQQVVHYGLPMYRIGTEPVAPGSDAAETPPSTEAADAAFATTPDPRTGVPSAAIELDMRGVERNDVDGAGAYYSLDGNTLHVKDRPVQPLSITDVPIPSAEPAQVPHGTLITALTSREVAAAGIVEEFHPYTAQPIIDQTKNEATDASPGDAIFPATLARVTRSTDVTGAPSGTLLFSAGQFRPTGAGVGTQRLFDQATVQVLYGSSDDFVPPTIKTTRGALVSGAAGAARTVGFVVDTDDTAGRVVVLFKDVAERTWRSIDLVDTDPQPGVAHWTGGAVVPATFEHVEFFIQACDLNGNCSTSNNKASNFQPTAAVNDAQLTVIATGNRVSGWFIGASVPVTITSTDNSAIEYSLDGAEWADYQGSAIAVAGDGVHVVEARDLCGNASVAIVPIDTTAPLISATASPVTAPAWSSSAVTVRITAIDPSGSGIDAITYSVSGGTPQTVAGETVDVVVTAEGVTTITYSAIDAAQNPTVSGSIEVRLDLTAPTVACSRQSDTTTWYSANQTVTCTPSDAASGPASGDPIVLSTFVAPGTETAAATTNTADACDAAGNCVTAGPFTFKVDMRAPEVICPPPAVPASGWFAANVTVSCTASDGGSGVVGPLTFTLPTNVAAGGADAAAFTSATTVFDVAGNSIAVGPFGPFAIDLAAPTATIDVPAVGATYTIGAVVTPVVACADPGSGVASCTPSSAKLDTSTLGTKTFSVTVVDRVGIRTTVTRTYNVGYGVCLKYNPNQPNQLLGVVIVAVQLCNASGANLSSPSIPLRATSIDGTIAPPPNHYDPANSHHDFKYVLGTYYYHMFANELAGVGVGAGPHSLGLSVNGVGGHSAAFTLR